VWSSDLDALVVFALLAVACAAPSKTKTMDAQLFQHIDIVNNAKTTWRAGINTRFINATEWFVRRQVGAMKAPFKLPERDIQVRADIPSDFDSRTTWGTVCPSTKEVRDQAACGSCWAFGAVEAMTDRFCIKSNGTQTPHISAEDMNSCCGVQCGSGCDGGYPEGAWSHAKSAGIVTGGNYNTKQGCMPYSIPNCDHHTTGQYSPCGNEGPTPTCHKVCETGYTKSYTADKNYFSDVYSVASNPDKIATEIMTNGPVEGAFTVYEDFVNYKSGVYQHVSGQVLGGHAIKILGWGVDNNVEYWIVANSWNPDWGDQGYFKIKRGNDECGIESSIVAGLPKLA